MVSTTHRRDLLWAIEEALRCGATTAVIGEMRAGAIDGVAIRRLSLAAAESGTLALLLRTEPPGDASTAATRWVVGAASNTNVIPGREHSERTRTFGASRNDEKIKPRIAAQLVRNRRGPTGTWILEWSGSDGQFILATHAQPLAAPALDRPHRQVA
jgi:protein ImuA